MQPPRVGRWRAGGTVIATSNMPSLSLSFCLMHVFRSPIAFALDVYMVQFERAGLILR